MTPPVLHHASVTTFFSSFFAIYLHFFTKTGPLDAPHGGCPGPSHRPHPLRTPLSPRRQNHTSHKDRRTSGKSGPFENRSSESFTLADNSTANRFCRIYMFRSMVFLTNLRLIVEYIIGVYYSCWFNIKVKHSWVEGPHHVFQLQQLRHQDSAVVDA